MHLTYVKGCCHSSQFKLEVPSVEFKKVVVGSRACRRVHLHNFGDLGPQEYRAFARHLAKAR